MLACGAAGRIESGAVAWLTAHLDHVHPAGPDGVVRAEALKPFGELAFVLTLLAERDPDALSAAEPLFAFVERTAGSVDWEALCAFDSRGVIAIATMVRFLTARGRDVTAWRRRLEQRLRAGDERAIDTAPHRVLELRYLVCDASDHEMRAARAVYEDCVAASHLMPALQSRHDAYAITHAVIYVTRNGSRPASAVLGAAQAARLGALLDAWRFASLAEGDLDLLAEILFCDALLARRDPLLERPSLALARRSQRPDGALPPRVRLPGHVQPRTGAEEFALFYHTTLVWFFATRLLAASA